MKINKSHLKCVAFLAVLLWPVLCSAVTREEMEEARTIAAKSYLRYANDGSGYLDDINPKTMAELEAALKTKEKENIKAFKAIAVPTDYQGWDKDKLVEYWAVTAFKDKGLLEKGRGGRIRARSQINKMTISKPSSAPAVQATATKPAEQPSAPAPTAETNNSSMATAESPDSLANNLAKAEASLINQEEAQLDEDTNVEKATNYTWVYIMILGILVAVVIALVVYAANVFKKNGKDEGDSHHHEDDSDDIVHHYETLLADKDVEISMLKKKLESATRQNTDLQAKLESLENTVKNMPASQPQNKEVSDVAESRTETPAPAKPALRSIYLGRANSRGIFVRADRTLNVGHSVFVLTTSDGYSGTFKVADSPAAWSLALSNPEEYLETACTGHDLDDTSDYSKIVTESPGTAVFEGGCWRVIRKSKIRYE